MNATLHITIILHYFLSLNWPMIAWRRVSNSLRWARRYSRTTTYFLLTPTSWAQGATITDAPSILSGLIQIIMWYIPSRRQRRPTLLHPQFPLRTRSGHLHQRTIAIRATPSVCYTSGTHDGLRRSRPGRRNQFTPHQRTTKTMAVHSISGAAAALTVTLQAQSDSVTLMVLVFTASRPRVSGCPATRPAAGAPSAVPRRACKGGSCGQWPVGRFHVISKQQAELHAAFPTPPPERQSKTGG